MEVMRTAAIESGDSVKMFESSNQQLVNKSTRKYATAATMLKSGAALRAAKKSVAGSPLHLGHVELSELPTLYVVLPIFNEVVAYSKANNIAW